MYTRDHDRDDGCDASDDDDDDDDDPYGDERSLEYIYIHEVYTKMRNEYVHRKREREREDMDEAITRTIEEDAAGVTACT